MRETKPRRCERATAREKFATDLRELGVPVFLKKPFAAEDRLRSLHAELHKEPVSSVA